MDQITAFAAIVTALSLTARRGNISVDDRNVSTGSPEGVSSQPSADSGSQAAESVISVTIHIPTNISDMRKRPTRRHPKRAKKMRLTRLI